MSNCDSYFEVDNNYNNKNNKQQKINNRNDIMAVDTENNNTMLPPKTLRRPTRKAPEQTVLNKNDRINYVTPEFRRESRRDRHRSRSRSSSPVFFDRSLRRSSHQRDRTLSRSRSRGKNKNSKINNRYNNSNNRKEVRVEVLTNIRIIANRFTLDKNVLWDKNENKYYLESDALMNMNNRVAYTCSDINNCDAYVIINRSSGIIDCVKLTREHKCLGNGYSNYKNNKNFGLNDINERKLGSIPPLLKDALSTECTSNQYNTSLSPKFSSQPKNQNSNGRSNTGKKQEQAINLCSDDEFDQDSSMNNKRLNDRDIKNKGNKMLFFDEINDNINDYIKILQKCIKSCNNGCKTAVSLNKAVEMAFKLGYTNAVLAQDYKNTQDEFLDSIRSIINYIYSSQQKSQLNNNKVSNPIINEYYNNYNCQINNNMNINDMKSSQQRSQVNSNNVLNPIVHQHYNNNNCYINDMKSVKN